MPDLNRDAVTACPSCGSPARTPGYCDSGCERRGERYDEARVSDARLRALEAAEAEVARLRSDLADKDTALTLATNAADRRGERIALLEADLASADAAPAATASSLAANVRSVVDLARRGEIAARDAYARLDVLTGLELLGAADAGAGRVEAPKPLTVEALTRAVSIVGRTGEEWNARRIAEGLLRHLGSVAAPPTLIAPDLRARAASIGPGLDLPALRWKDRGIEGYEGIDREDGDASLSVSAWSHGDCDNAWEVTITGKAPDEPSARAAVERIHATLRDAPGLVREQQAEIERLRAEVDRLKPKPVKRRGVDFPCEECGAMEGNCLDNGWFRCAKCGYPSK